MFITRKGKRDFVLCRKEAGNLQIENKTYAETKASLYSTVANETCHRFLNLIEIKLHPELNDTLQAIGLATSLSITRSLAVSNWYYSTLNQ